jgi:hypothetical protein
MMITWQLALPEIGYKLFWTALFLLVIDYWEYTTLSSFHKIRITCRLNQERTGEISQTSFGRQLEEGNKLC